MACTNYVNAVLKVFYILNQAMKIYLIYKIYIIYVYMHLKSGGFRTNLVYALVAHTKNFQFSSIAI